MSYINQMMPGRQGFGMQTFGGMQRQNPMMNMMMRMMQTMMQMMMQMGGMGGMGGGMPGMGGMGGGMPSMGGGFSPQRNPGFGCGCSQGGNMNSNFGSGGRNGMPGFGHFGGGNCSSFRPGSSFDGPHQTGCSGAVPTGSVSLGNSVARAEAVQTKGGRSSMKEGTMSLRDPKTGKIHSFNFANGGGGRGAIPYGKYEISNGRRRSDKSSMQVGGYGYSFDLTQKGQRTGQARDPRFNTKRELLRVHPDGGSKGTIGCFGIKGGRAKQQEFYELAQRLSKANGGKFTIDFAKPNA